MFLIITIVTITLQLCTFALFHPILVQKENKIANCRKDDMKLPLMEFSYV